MKNIVKSAGLLSLLLIPLLALTQTNPLDNLIRKYAHQDGIYFLDLTTNMFNPTADSTSSSSQREINLKVLSVQNNANTNFALTDIYNEMMGTIDKSAYKGLIEIKKSGQNVEFLVRKDGNMVKNLIIAVKEEKEITLIAASGNFDLKDLAKFKQIEKCKGLQILGQLSEE